MVSDKKIFSHFPYISHCRGRGHFWPKGYNLNKLGRGPLGDAGFRLEDFSHLPFISLCKTIDPRAGPFLVLDKKIFTCFPYISLCKTFDPGAGPFLAPRV